MAVAQANCLSTRWQLCTSLKHNAGKLQQQKFAASAAATPDQEPQHQLGETIHTPYHSTNWGRQFTPPTTALTGWDSSHPYHSTNWMSQFTPPTTTLTGWDNLHTFHSANWGRQFTPLPQHQLGETVRTPYHSTNWGRQFTLLWHKGGLPQYK